MQLNEEVITSKEGIRATWVEVNLSRLKQNLAAIRTFVSPSKVMIIVKANAYGHGLVEVTKYLSELVDYIGVAVLEEGILLRQIGVTSPILVLGGIWGDQVPLYLQYGLTFAASSVERLEQINLAAREKGVKAKVHLKIDTGMERIGVHYYNARTIQEAALESDHIEVEGIFSHFANADSPDLTSANQQLERFQEVLGFYEEKGLPQPIRHIANSAAILNLPQSHMDMVRPGILFYGVYPRRNMIQKIPVQPALSWKSRVVYFKVVEAGHPVSYGSTWKSDHPVRLVTLPVGYGDGYFRTLSNKTEVLLHGNRYPQVGTICMDQMMVNIESDSAFNGDEVTLLGEEDGLSISAQDLADWAGTIPYEILTNINTRVPRLYLKKDE